MYYVYILYSEKLNKFYIGFTSNLEERLAKHNRSHKGYTQLGIPWVLSYSEAYATKPEARRREIQLKAWKNPERLLRLMGNVNPEHPD